MCMETFSTGGNSVEEKKQIGLYNLSSRARFELTTSLLTAKRKTRLCYRDNKLIKNNGKNGFDRILQYMYILLFHEMNA